MKKKVISVLMSTVMIASVLSGCGGQSNEPAAAPADTAAEETKSEAAGSSEDAAESEAETGENTEGMKTE